MRASDWVLLLAVTAYAGASALEYFAFPVGFFDEPQQLVAAELVAQGWVPHRDFSSPYPPLPYYLNALAFWLLGPSVLSVRMLSCAFYVVLVGALAVDVRRSLGAGWSSTAVALAGVLLVGNAFVYYWIPAYALLFVALLVYLCWRRAPDPRTLLACAFLTGVAATAKLNFAAYLAAAIAVDQAFVIARARSLRSLQPLAVFLAALAIPLAAYLLPYERFVGEVIDQVVLSPPRDMGPYRIMTLRLTPEGLRAAGVVVFPLLWVAIRQVGLGRGWGGAALPLGLATAVLGVLAWTNGRHDMLTPSVGFLVVGSLIACRRAGARFDSDEFIVLVCAAFFAHYVLSRADETHLATFGPLVALLLPLLASPMRGDARLATIGLCAVLFLAPWPGTLSRRLPHETGVRQGIELLTAKDFSLRRGDSRALMEGPFPPPAPLALLYPETHEIEAMRYLHTRLGPDDPIYIGLQRHYRFFDVSVRAYWILGRVPGVRDYFLLPGINTRREVQERMISDLERNRVEWAVLIDKRGGDEEFRRRRWVGSDHLDGWFRNRYEVAESFGRYQLNRLRPEAPR